MPWDWFKIALLFLQIGNKLADWAREKNQMDAGRDAAFAREAASILAKTQVAKKALAEASGLTEDQVDAALKDLEPK